MPLQNRVTPFSTIEATHHRGLYMGNRGCLHDDSKQLRAASRRHTHWIVCELSYKGKCRELMSPGRYTELFFLDEAVAFAAGHRPCALCRRGAFNEYRAAWQRATGEHPTAAKIDTVLHPQRAAQVTSGKFDHAAVETLPSGTFVIRPDRGEQAWLVHGSSLRLWSHAGYGAPSSMIPGEDVQVITPPAQVAVFRQNYPIRVHSSALA